MTKLVHASSPAFSRSFDLGDSNWSKGSLNLNLNTAAGNVNAKSRGVSRTATGVGPQDLQLQDRSNNNGYGAQGPAQSITTPLQLYELENGRSNSRIPELQMINKLYGLVPKRFLVQERAPGADSAAHLGDTTKGRQLMAVKGIAPKARAPPPSSSKTSHLMLHQSFSIKGDKPSTPLLASQSSFDSVQTLANKTHTKAGDRPKSSYDGDKGDDPNPEVQFLQGRGSHSASNTPLITRKMPFVKNYAAFAHKVKAKTASTLVAGRTKVRGVLDGAKDCQGPQKQKQRVIHIDLNTMRWIDGDDKLHHLHQQVPSSAREEGESEAAGNHKEVAVPEPAAPVRVGLISHSTPAPASALKKSQFKGRKTLSFDESTLLKEERGSCKGKDEQGKPDTKKTFATASPAPTRRPATATAVKSIGPSAITHQESASAAPVNHWTTGKTTAERRAKLQRSFSVHPSSIEASEAPPGESFDYGVGESEAESSPRKSVNNNLRGYAYGKRQLHVENVVDDVDTLLSESARKSSGSGGTSSTALGPAAANTGCLDDPILRQFTTIGASAGTSTNNPAPFPSRSPAAAVSGHHLLSSSRSPSSHSYEMPATKLSTVHLSGFVMKPQTAYSYIVNEATGATSKAGTGTFTTSGSVPTDGGIMRPPLKKSISLEQSSHCNDKIKGSATEQLQLRERQKKRLTKSVSFEDQHQHQLHKSSTKSTSSTTFVGSISNKTRTAKTNHHHSQNHSKLFKDSDKLRFKRPKTAPTNKYRDKVNGENKRSTETESRVQPLKAVQRLPENGKRSFVKGNGTSAGEGEGAINLNSQCSEEDQQKSQNQQSKHSSSSSVSGGNSNSNMEEQEVEAAGKGTGSKPRDLKSNWSHVQRATYLKLLQRPTRRKSLSIDDDSLLKFSTNVASTSKSTTDTEDGASCGGSRGIAAEAVAGCSSRLGQATTTPHHHHSEREPTAKLALAGALESCLRPGPALSSKKADECIKIYRKLGQIGCNVKLETIFRGMMSPVEFQQFVGRITEDAASSSATMAEEVSGTPAADDKDAHSGQVQDDKFGHADSGRGRHEQAQAAAAAPPTATTTQ